MEEAQVLDQLYRANAALQERQRLLELELVEAQMHLVQKKPCVDCARYRRALKSTRQDKAQAIETLKAENASLRDKLKIIKRAAHESAKGFNAALAAERARRQDAEQKYHEASLKLERSRLSNMPIDDDDEEIVIEPPDFPDFPTLDDDGRDRPSHAQLL